MIYQKLFNHHHTATLLYEKDIPFQWNKFAQKVFDALKEKFTTAPVLIVFDPTKPIYIETDTSDYTLGVCLSQKNNQGCMYPVIFLS